MSSAIGATLMARVEVALPPAHLDKLASIRRRLASLSPDWSDPRRFYDRRDTLVEELALLERGR
jgi:hypothetical protein